MTELVNYFETISLNTLFKLNHVERGIYLLIAAYSDLFSRFCADHDVRLREMPVVSKASSQ
jgi:hypothetical protein